MFYHPLGQGYDDDSPYQFEATEGYGYAPIPDGYRYADVYPQAYGQYPEDAYGDYVEQYVDGGSGDVDEMGYHGLSQSFDPEDDEAYGGIGYPQYPYEPGYYVQPLYDEEGDVEGYVADEPPASNARCTCGDLSGYVSEKTVNPTVELRKAADLESPPVYPSFFKPHF